MLTTTLGAILHLYLTNKLCHLKNGAIHCSDKRGYNKYHLSETLLSGNLTNLDLS